MPARVELRSCIFGAACDRSASAAAASNNNTDVIERIRKILDRGLHPNTPVAEASRAMRLATELMQRHELDRAAVFAATDDAAANKLAAESGAAWQVKVTGTRRERWLVDLSSACQGFGVKSYSSTYSRTRTVLFTFYGLATSAEAAALAFALFVEQVPLMTAAYAPSAETLATMSAANARFNYRQGLCDGLRRAVREHATAENKRIETMTCRALTLQLAIEARASAIEADYDDDDEVIHDDAIDLPDDQFYCSNDDDDDDAEYERRKAASELEAMRDELSSINRELAASSALVVYRKTTEQSVVDALKVKIRPGVAWTPSVRPRDRRAYDDGRRDAKRVRMQ